jgi:hypothetical protein
VVGSDLDPVFSEVGSGSGQNRPNPPTLHGFDKVERIRLFNQKPESRTRLAAYLLNMRAEKSRTEVRKNFYTQGIVPNWDQISSIDKNCNPSNLIIGTRWQASTIETPEDSEAAAPSASPYGPVMPPATATGTTSTY